MVFLVTNTQLSSLVGKLKIWTNIAGNLLMGKTYKKVLPEHKYTPIIAANIFLLLNCQTRHVFYGIRKRKKSKPSKQPYCRKLYSVHFVPWKFYRFITEFALVLSTSIDSIVAYFPVDSNPHFHYSMFKT